MRYDVRMRLDLLDQTFFFQPGDDLLARSETIGAFELLCFSEIGVTLSNKGFVNKRDLAFDGQHIDLCQPMPLADLEVVEVVRRRNLHRA